MISKSLFISILGVALISCTSNSTKPESVAKAEVAEQQAPSRPYAELHVPQTIDMGVFEGDQLVKETTIQLTNTGTDDLVILGAQPECNCTQILYIDSVIPAGQRGRVTVSQDLSEYPADTIRKQFGILSNDRHEQVKRITLIGVRR